MTAYAFNCISAVPLIGIASATRDANNTPRQYRYQFLVKAASRKVLNELLQRIRAFALEHKWGATALVIDVDPLTLM